MANYFKLVSKLFKNITTEHRAEVQTVVRTVMKDFVPTSSNPNYKG